jgi:hypothetical protein
MTPASVEDPSVPEKAQDNASNDTATENGADTDIESQAVQAGEAPKELISDEEWAKEPSNPLNWPLWRKVMLISCISSMGFMA